MVKNFYTQFKAHLKSKESKRLIHYQINYTHVWRATWC